MTADLGLAELLTGAQSPEDMRRAVHGLLLERLSRDPSFAALAPLLSSRAAPTEAPPVPKTDGFISGDTHSPISDLLREASAAAAAEGVPGTRSARGGRFGTGGMYPVPWDRQGLHEM
ncbi:hypothetical protein ACRAWF_31505 [Streptomyces sp. L7]